MKNKMKDYKKQLIISAIIILVPIIVGIIFWSRLPEEIATHFDSNGVANGWSNKYFAVFGLPLFLLAVHFFCIAATLNDPKRNHAGTIMFHLIFWICPVVSLLCGFSIYGYELGMDIVTGSVASIFVGILFLVVGNYLPKCRQNYTIGVKTPWTLADDDTWNKTHRLAGWQWMLSGIIIIISGLIKWDWLMLPVILVAAIVPLAYSFVYYKKHVK